MNLFAAELNRPEFRFVDLLFPLDCDDRFVSVPLCLASSAFFPRPGGAL